MSYYFTSIVVCLHLDFCALSTGTTMVPRVLYFLFYSSVDGRSLEMHTILKRTLTTNKKFLPINLLNSV